ncbi:MAG: ABC transporter ATP-binding protein/permease [Candidatus Nanopelagicales bacterium]|jgi:ATP-binding cassette subfamily B protein|nr:ABC transporter ATP-binding protein/permease [Candidatus Nanopelagicales bacterium]
MPTDRRQPRTRATLTLFWSAAARYPVRLGLSLGVPVLTVFSAAFVGPWVISRLLTAIQAGTISWASAWPLVVAYGVSQLIGHVIGWRIALYTTWTFQVRAMRQLYTRVFDHLTMQSIGFHADRFSGSLVSQTNKLTAAFERFWDTVIWQVVPVLTTVVAAVTILVFILPWYAAFLAVMVAAFTAFVVVSARTMERLNVAEAQASTRMTGFLADVMTNITAVKAAGGEVAETRTAHELATQWEGRSFGVMRAFLGFSTGYSSVVALINTGAVVAAVLAAEQRAISVAAVYLATTYTITVTDQLWEITQVMRQYNRVLGDAHDMVEILGVTPTVADQPGAADFRRGPGTVQFDRIAFTHEGAGDDDALFTDFSLALAPGEKIGLVGHSGSGKSTLVRLLLRFSDVDAGAVRIDGQDLREVTQASLRRAIAYVAQEPLLFHRSIAENIAYGRPEASQEQIEDAARKAYAHDFVTRLPDGYATMVGERGVKLSGGQRQRIAIARAVLKDAPILVLDEATSALDSESEVHIQAALAEAMRGRTTLVIAHRLSTVQAMDRIVVLAEGRIVEQGTHHQLLAAGGVYAGLWAHQSGGFLEEDQVIAS